MIAAFQLVRLLPQPEMCCSAGSQVRSLPGPCTGTGATGQNTGRKRKAPEQTTLTALLTRPTLGRMVRRRLQSGKAGRVMDLSTAVEKEQEEHMFAELFDSFSNSSKVNCTAMAKQWNHAGIERKLRNGGDWAGVHLKTAGQLKMYMNKLENALAEDEVARCWVPRQAADGGGGGGAPGGAGWGPGPSVDRAAADSSASGAMPGLGGSGAAAGGASGATARRAGGAAGEAAAGSAGRAVLGGFTYDAATVAHCESVLRAMDKPVPPNAAQVVQQYRGGRGGKLIACANRLKRMKTCARCMLHDKAVLGKQPTHVFLKEGHTLSCPYIKPEHARQCPLCEKEYKRQSEYNTSARKAKK